MILYAVRQGIWGTNKKENLYFETKERADDYYSSVDYADPPCRVAIPDKIASDLLYKTEWILNPKDRQ